KTERPHDAIGRRQKGAPAALAILDMADCRKSRIPIEPFQTTHSFLSVMPSAFMYEPAPRPRLFVRKGSRQLDRPCVHACSEPKARVERVTGRESCASRPKAFCRAARGDRNQIIVLPLETGCRKVRGSGAQ